MVICLNNWFQTVFSSIPERAPVKRQMVIRPKNCDASRRKCLTFRLHENERCSVEVDWDLFTQTRFETHYFVLNSEQAPLYRLIVVRSKQLRERREKNISPARKGELVCRSRWWFVKQSWFQQLFSIPEQAPLQRLWFVLKIDTKTVEKHAWHLARAKK